MGVDYVSTPIIAPFLASVLLSLALGGYAMRRYRSPEARYFIITMMLAAFWSFAACVQLLSPDFTDKRFWSDIKYVSITAVPVTWFLMALAYSGSRRFRTASGIGALFVIPLITLTLIATNSLHGLVFEVQWPAENAHFTSVGRTYGPWFWVNALFAYALVAASMAIYTRASFKLSGRRRQQALMMLGGSFVPILLNALYLSNPAAFYQLDYTPVAFSVSGVFFAIGLFRFSMLDLQPIARREIMRVMLDPVIVTDARGVIADMNDAATTAYGLDRSVIGTHFRGAIRGLGDVLSREGDNRTFSAEVSRRIGDKLRWFDARINLLEDELGAPLGYLCVLRDVTERKAAERQLLAAAQRVDELSRLKSAFLSNMSHEIRTPLAGIIGLADMLAEETEGEHKEFAGLIRDGGTRLLRMLNSVLSVAHLSSGKIEQHTRKVDIVDLMQTTINSFRTDAERAGLDLRFLEPSGPVDAVLDPDHFSHAVSHLLDNAIQFTESGRVNVRLETTADEVQVMISDTGRGMNARFLEQAAEAFSQEEFDLDRPVEGSGLGLRVAYGLVEEMRGRISVDSAQGAGTSFTVTVPRRAIPA